MRRVDELRRRAGALHERWRKLPAGEKNMRTAMAVAACCAVYFGLVWPVAKSRLEKIEYDLAKQAVRSKAAGKPAPAPVMPPSLGGMGAAQAQEELAALRQRTDELRAALDELRRGFAPADDNLALSLLKSGLTSLAEAGDMEVLALEHIYRRPEDRDRPPTPELIRDAIQANPFKRPLLSMRARASYRGLMQFLDGLASLPYVAAPVWSDISVKTGRHPDQRAPGGTAPAAQWLEVQIHFAI